MSQVHSTIKRRPFSHLSLAQRGMIEALLREKRPVAYIAQQVGVHRSTVYRELKRGTVEQITTNLEIYRRYFAESGQIIYLKNRRHCRKALRFTEAYPFISHVVHLVKEKKLSPDAAVGCTDRSHLFNRKVCTKTIYNYIDKGIIPIKSIDLPLRVKRRVKRSVCRKRRRRYGDSIDRRPDINGEFGHWEIDTVVGRRKREEVLLTLDERKTRKRIILKIAGKSSGAVEKGLKQIMKSFGDKAPLIFRTITADNGSEFCTLHHLFPWLHIYYCHPYSAYERGINEKQNSLVRRFIPKGRSMQMVSDETVQKVEDWINNLPRRIFGYQTANERFEHELKNLA